MFTAFSILVTAICFYKIGWLSAHQTVATECKTLGKFYVGDEVFECKEVK